MPALGDVHQDQVVVAEDLGAVLHNNCRKKSSSWRPLPEPASPWHVGSSRRALRTINPIRRVVDNLKMDALVDPAKEVIPLSLGDPTAFANLTAPLELTEAVAKHLKTGAANGYLHAAGAPAARAAIAAAYGTPEAPLTANDIFIASGCSGSLDLALSALLDPGDNVLVPRPGFPLYQVIADSIGAESRHYCLLPHSGWEADLEHLESLIDGRTKAILVNNPSNPCGSVYSSAHLRAIIKIAENYRLPIIADEIYGSMAFGQPNPNGDDASAGSGGAVFVPMASLTKEVPIIATGGLAKQYLVPGWRVGWLLLHDRNGALTEVRQGLSNLAQLVLGANSLVQAALPEVLCPPAGSEMAARLAEFHESYVGLLRDNALFTESALGAVEGLRVTPPQGAMYAMVEIETAAFVDLPNDEEFCRALLAEESVVALPGACFGAPNFFRVVFCAPHEKLAEAYSRIAAFCGRHRA